MLEALPRANPNLSEDWMILVFLASLIGLAYTRRVHPTRINRLWNSAWNIRTMRQTIREEPNTPRANLIFNTSFYLQAALVIYCALKYSNHAWFSLQGLGFYLILVAAVFGVYLTKRLSIRLIKFVADADFGLGEYEYAVFMMNRLLGILIVPVSMLIVYAPTVFLPQIFIGGLILVSILLIYRLLRSLMTALELGIAPFYILFYICTLEILPTAIGIRMVLAF